jgi:hypothetical protein
MSRPGDNPESPRPDLKRLWDAITKRAGLTGVRAAHLRGAMDLACQSSADCLANPHFRPQRARRRSIAPSVGKHSLLISVRIESRMRNFGLNAGTSRPAGPQRAVNHRRKELSLFWEVLFRLEPFIQPICGKVGHSRVRFRKSECFSEDFPMTPKTIATLLILSAFAAAGANSASAQGGGFKGGGFHGGGGSGLHGRSFHGRGLHGRGVDAYGFMGGYAYGDDNGHSDWYGTSPGHDECTLFRRRVMTRDGWRVRMVPIC